MLTIGLNLTSSRAQGAPSEPLNVVNDADNVVNGADNVVKS